MIELKVDAEKMIPSSGREIKGKARRRVALWLYDLRDELFTALAAEEIDVVVLLNGESRLVPSYSIHDLYVRSEKVPVVEDTGVFSMSDKFLRGYANCICRLSFIPKTRKHDIFSLGAIGGDNLVDWAAFHCETFRRILLEYGVDEVWLSAPSHLGLDNALEFVAGHMGVRTLCFRQSPIAGKFFFSRNSQPTIESSNLRFAAYKNGAEPPDLFYMPGRAIPPYQGAALQVDRMRTLLRAPFATHRADAWARVYLAMQRRYWAWGLFLMDLLCPQTREVALRRLCRSLSHRRQLRARRFCSAVECSRPYVYFALHNEPEASTSALGGEFTNQADAITALSAVLPSGWLIRVKENPVQGPMFRDTKFFARLGTLGNVCFVPDEADSDALIDGAAVTATVTGTVGFEALLRDRPCVHFGDAWYQGFPGAYPFTADIDLDKLANARINRAALDAAVNARFSAAADGLIFPRSSALIPPPIDWSALMQTTARSLAAISATMNDNAS